jgi:hypothetical protein
MKLFIGTIFCEPATDTLVQEESWFRPGIPGCFFKHLKITYLTRSWQKHNNPAQKPLQKKGL